MHASTCSAAGCLCDLKETNFTLKAIARCFFTWGYCVETHEQIGAYYDRDCDTYAAERAKKIWCRRVHRIKKCRGCGETPCQDTAVEEWLYNTYRPFIDP